MGRPITDASGRGVHVPGDFHGICFKVAYRCPSGDGVWFDAAADCGVDRFVLRVVAAHRPGKQPADRPGAGESERGVCHRHHHTGQRAEHHRAAAGGAGAVARDPGAHAEKPRGDRRGAEDAGPPGGAAGRPGRADGTAHGTRGVCGFVRENRAAGTGRPVGRGAPTGAQRNPASAGPAAAPHRRPAPACRTRWRTSEAPQ